MPPRHKPRAPENRDRTEYTTTQQDDADILVEAGAERDEETGDLVVDEETVRELGAVDATSVRENRRLDRVIQKKREGKKDVPFNTKDPIVIYGSLLRYWTPDSIDITVKRLLGGATTMPKPINGAALYDAVVYFHGQHAETEYEIKFTTSGRYLGTGRITIPDTRPTGQQGQSVQQPYYPNGGAPPGYTQVAPPPWQPPPQQQATTPTMQATPSASDQMAVMSQMFELFQRMQAAKAPQPQFQVPPTGVAPPTDPAAMMSQMFEMFQKMQGQVVAAPVQPQFVAPPQPAPPPPPQPVVDPMAMMTQMFDLFQKMQSSMRSAAEPGPSAFRRPQYDASHREGGPPRYQGPPGPPQAPQRQPTMAEQFRESIGVVRSAMGVVQEMESMLPGREQESPGLPADDDDSPVRVIDTGPAKIVVNKSDGSTRIWETGMANMDKIFKWVGEQHEVIQKAHAAKQQPQRQQLPPGYVEVGPGYTPPPGYVAVPVEEQQEDLPPPPANVPPPVSQRAAWGAPTVPEDEN
jgi:hypothetical protein